MAAVVQVRGLLHQSKKAYGFARAFAFLFSKDKTLCSEETTAMSNALKGCGEECYGADIVAKNNLPRDKRFVDPGL